MTSQNKLNSKHIWATNIIGSMGFFVWGYSNPVNNSVLPYLRDFVFPDRSDG